MDQLQTALVVNQIVLSFYLIVSTPAMLNLAISRKWSQKRVDFLSGVQFGITVVFAVNTVTLVIATLIK